MYDEIHYHLSAIIDIGQQYKKSIFFVTDSSSGYIKRL